MTKLIAIDTSSQACSVAIIEDGELMEKYEVIPRLHAQKILPMVESLLAEGECVVSQFDAVAFARGPGSFTGIRIAAAVAQGLAFGADLPVLPISTLASMAQTVYRENGQHQIVSVLDARMSEIYWGCFRIVAGLAERLGEERMTSPGDLLSATDLNLEEKWVGAGDGWVLSEKFPDQVRQSINLIFQHSYPHAMDVAQLALRDYDLGLAVSAENAHPAYMRDKSAWRRSG